MTGFSEAQVQRYSRQILLKEVGGRGQRRLLEAPFEVVAGGPAIDVAVAYLAASGTPLRATGPFSGFVDGVPLSAFAPDVDGPGPVAGWLGPLAVLPAAEGRWHRVAVGPGLVLGLRAGIAAPGALRPRDEAEPVTQGALAALVAQRFVLGLEPADVVELRFEDGRWTRRP
jgi:hypothetical protein